jgi:hypothetical protein
MRRSAVQRVYRALQGWLTPPYTAAKHSGEAMKSHLTLAVAALSAAGVLLYIVPAKSADLPADCSQATIPDQPVKGQIAGKDFVPDSTTFSTINHPQINGATYDAFDFYLRTNDQSGQGGIIVVINTIVPANTFPDGQTFLILPTNDASKQPTVGPGAAGIQGWSIEDDADGINVDDTTQTASIRLQFGMRANNTLTGKIYFCAPGVKGSYVAGTFKIDVTSE